mmetsp:Transcript_18946/g.37210  ORF Transcript_18946/g.37210 Transcript_18946/m.37210 type:complete len:686 (+) Transcript_18946:133-2190(+)
MVRERNVGGDGLAGEDSSPATNTVSAVVGKGTRMRRRMAANTANSKVPANDQSRNQGSGKSRAKKSTRKKSPQQSESANSGAKISPGRNSLEYSEDNLDEGVESQRSPHRRNEQRQRPSTSAGYGEIRSHIYGPATRMSSQNIHDDYVAATIASAQASSARKGGDRGFISARPMTADDSNFLAEESKSPIPTTGLLARANRARETIPSPGHAVEQVSSELEEVQRSVARLREQRLIVERIKREAESKDRRINELDLLVRRLRSQSSQASLQALERERTLRSKILSLEQQVSHKRDNDVTVALELKSLLQEAQKTENGLRCELARSQAELEESRTHSESSLKELRDINARLLADKETLEDRAGQLQRDLEDKTRDLERAYSRQTTAVASVEKRCEELDRLLTTKKHQLAEWKDKVDSLTLVNTKQREQLEAKTTALEEAERREHLLQGTIDELDENLNVLREHVEVTEGADQDLRQELKRANQRLEQADEVMEQLRNELIQAKLDSQITEDQSKRQKSNFTEYEASLQRAGAHRKRMELQLRNLAAKVQELQAQLVEEMRTNAALSRQLEEERSSRSKVSRERLRILEEFYDEENKLKETLEHPFFEKARERALQNTSLSVSEDYGVDDTSPAALTGSRLVESMQREKKHGQIKQEMYDGTNENFMFTHEMTDDELLYGSDFPGGH